MAEANVITRSMTIGSEVDSAKISTQCRDGVLTIHLPKT